MSTSVTTGLARLSYLACWEPTSIKGSKPAYRCTPLIPKTDKATISEIKEAIDEAIEIGKSKFWNGKVPKKDFKLPFRDGDAEQKDDPEDEDGKGPEYIGMMFFNANSKDQPSVVDTKSQPILDETKVYAGCWGLVNVNFYPFSNNGSNGVAVSLNHIMKVKDDTKFSSRVSLASAFADIDVTEFEKKNLLG